jgi:hypothetical protein
MIGDEGAAQIVPFHGAFNLLELDTAEMVQRPRRRRPWNLRLAQMRNKSFYDFKFSFPIPQS